MNRQWFKPPTALKTAILVLLLGTVFYFPLFLRLDSKPLREWDEARNAINALEMSKTGNLLVKTYNFEPDLWETKPPLLVWLQAAGFKVLGYNELPVRLPSALALFALAFFMVFWFRKHLGSMGAGICAALILLSSPGIIHEHAGRTGDHDAMLLCFSFITLCAFFTYTETYSRKSLGVFTLFMILSVYTKSVAILMLMPGILLYLLLNRSLLNVLKDYRLYVAIAAIVAGIGLFYAGRELSGPGYLEAVWHNELFPRYSNSSERYQYNVNDFWYYYRELRDWQFSFWTVPLLIAVLWNFACLKGKLYRFHLYLFALAFSFFLVISAGTGNFWYDLPLIPLCAGIIGLALISAALTLRRKFRRTPSNVIRMALLSGGIALFATPYSRIISKINDPSEHSHQVMYGYAFSALSERHPEIRCWQVYDPLGYNYPLVFYRKVYEEKGFQISDLPKDGPALKQCPVVVLDDQYKAFELQHPRHRLLFRDKLYGIFMTE